MLSKVKFKNLHKFSNFILVIKGFTLILLLVPLLAQSASGKKYYGYWTMGKSDGWNFDNESTKSHYAQFKSDFPQAKENNQPTKFGFYSKSETSRFTGVIFAGDMYRYYVNSDTSISTSLLKLYFSQLFFLIKPDTGLFFEISAGGVYSKFFEEKNSVPNGAPGKYGFGASASLGFNIDLFRWFGLNFQAGYHYTQGTVLGRSTSYDYAGGIALSF